MIRGQLNLKYCKQNYTGQNEQSIREYESKMFKNLLSFTR